MFLLRNIPTVLRRRSFIFWLLTIATFAFLIRVLYIIHVAQDIALAGDPYFYHTLANNLTVGGNVSNYPPWYPPGFPFILGLIEIMGYRSPVEQKFFMALIGSGTVVIVGLIGRRFVKPSVGLIAAGLGAVTPMLIATDGALGNETVYIFVISLILFHIYRMFDMSATRFRHWIWLGGLIALATYVRAEASLLLFFLAIPLAISQTKDLRQRLSKAGLCFLTCAICVSPWLARNYTRYDELFFSLNGAGTLVGSNCLSVYFDPNLRGLFDNNCLQEAIDSQATKSQLELNNRIPIQGSSSDLLGSARDFVTEHLSDVPSVMMIRAQRTWGLWNPTQQFRREAYLESKDKNWLSFGYRMNILLLALSVVGVQSQLRIGRKNWPLLAIVGQVTVTSMLIYGNTRFRAAAEPVLLLLAATGVAFIVRAFQLRSWSQARAQDSALREGTSEKSREGSRRVVTRLSLAAVLIIFVTPHLFTPKSIPRGSVSDSFSRIEEGPTLGTSESFNEWETVSGQWKIQNGAATISDVGIYGTAITIVKSLNTGVVLEAAMSSVSGRAGIVFRYVDPENYWAVVASPLYATWIVIKVSEGVETQLGNLGDNSFNQLESLIEISMVKDKIEISVSNGNVFEFSDKNFPNRSQVGLIGIGEEANGTRWEFFRVSSS